MPTDTPVNANRTERVLAYMLAAMIGLGLIAVVAIIIGTAVDSDAVRGGGGIWPIVFVTPGIALPLGFLLVIVLLAVRTIRRSRATRDAER